MPYGYWLFEKMSQMDACRMGFDSLEKVSQMDACRMGFGSLVLPSVGSLVVMGKCLV